MFKKFKTLNLKKSMTLIELVIYLGIISIILVVVIDVATNLVYSQNKTANSSEVKQNLEFALNKMTSSIANASQITGTYPSNSLTLTVEGQPVIYTLNGTTLEVQTGINPSMPITSSKVNIGPNPEGDFIFYKFTNGPASTIKINLKVGLMSDQRISQDLTTTILMRGK